VAGAFLIYNADEIDKLSCRIFEYGRVGGGPFLGRNARTFGGLFGGGGFGPHLGGHGMDILDACRDMYNFGQKIASGVLAIVNGIVYILTGIFVITSSV